MLDYVGAGLKGDCMESPDCGLASLRCLQRPMLTICGNPVSGTLCPWGTIGNRSAKARREDEMPESRRGHKRRRAMIEGILITGVDVFLVAVIFGLMTRTMVYHGKGSRNQTAA